MNIKNRAFAALALKAQRDSLLFNDFNEFDNWLIGSFSREDGKLPKDLYQNQRIYFSSNSKGYYIETLPIASHENLKEQELPTYSGGTGTSPLTGSLFVVYSLTKKHSYAPGYYLGVNSSSYEGYPLKYLKDNHLGDPIYDKSIMREYMKRMTNTEYLPVFGDEIYFYENNGADIHKLYKVQLQELTQGRGELLCFFELGTPAELFNLPDKETTLTKDTTQGEGVKIYAVDNDGNQTMLSIDDLKTLLGIS